ncbi:MAG: L-rhamnose isomerase [Promethearchaeota archaeon]
MDRQIVEREYEHARRAYAEVGVDTDAVLERFAGVPLSLHCWQGDDVGGFETPGSVLDGGGIQATGNFPGKARDVGELRRDLLKATSLIPGGHRVNLHAIYGEFGGERVDRDQIGVEHFQGWVDWAREHGFGLDFNATLFSHPLAESGFTLSHKDARVRSFWVEHVRRCREVAAHMGRELGTACVHNLWIPDGSKDTPVDRLGHRELLRSSLDEIYGEKYPREHLLDTVEGKLFGIGSEAFVVGSHEFYLCYALEKGIVPCLDMGHFHPTESVADKVSALLPFTGELLLHVSRGVRWDSDHVVIASDEVFAVMEEVVRAKALDRVHLALDYFDASINRVGAWVTGARATRVALLRALLQPHEALLELEEGGKLFQRLAFLEELKAMPSGAVWDYFCLEQGVPAGRDWIAEVEAYERDVLLGR